MKRTRLAPLLLAILAVIVVVPAWLWGDPSAIGGQSETTPTGCSPTDLHFVTAEPMGDLERNRPFPTEIHCLTGDGELVKRWESPRIYTQFVRHYQRQGIVLVGLGDTDIRELRVLAVRDLEHERRIEFAQSDSILEVHLVVGGVLPVALQLKQFDAAKNSFELRYLDWATLEPMAAPQELVNGGLTVELAGVGMSPEVAWVRIDAEGRLDTTRIGLRLPDDAIPAPLRFPDAGKGWNIVANTDQYLALQQVPYEKSQRSNSTLVYRRTAKEWKLHTLPGAETWLRPVGRWLVGQVAQMHQDSDPEKFVGVAPLLQNQHVILDPLEGSLATLALGADAEILMLGEGWILFRRGEELIRASLQGNELASARILVAAPIVEHAHWVWSAD